jgi:hypothetical protein
LERASPGGNLGLIIQNSDYKLYTDVLEIRN